MMAQLITQSESKKIYRLTGLLYVLVIILAGTSQGYIRGTLIVNGDAALSATNILENLDLFRMGISLDLMAFILDAIISILLYQIFKPYGNSLAMISSSLRLIAHPAIGTLNLLNHYLAIEMLSGAEYLGTFDQAQLESLSMFFMEAHKYGYMIAGAFFGVHLFLLGIQIYKAGIIPKLIGGLLLGSTFGYLIETFGNFTYPGYEEYTALIVGISAALGELSIAFYLLVVGRKI